MNIIRIWKRLESGKSLKAVKRSHSKHVLRSIHLKGEIKDAIVNAQPVIALESTVITHGMPYPHNIRTALSVESIIRNNGAIPATVGVIDGKLKVGLSVKELEFLADPSTKAIKTSRRDLSYVLSQKFHGGTTVSATIVAAHMAGISIFVTGGLGGVHRNASKTYDVSADLTELGRTPVALVCAGVKSILDIGLTLEYLETQGVPVLTYGKSNLFPSFFTPASDFKAPYHIDDTADIANLIDQHRQLNLQNGLVVAVPIPDEHAAAGNPIEEAIQRSLAEAEERKIIGKEITPFVLSRVAELTGGASLESNIHLIENNAKVGAQIAVALSALKQEGRSVGDQLHTVSNKQKKVTLRSTGDTVVNRRKRPVVIGGAVFDIKATATYLDVIAEATNPGTVHIGYGGVARNIAECLARLGCNPFLISGVGNDRIGDMLLNNMQKLNLDTNGLIKSTEHPTACCSMMANNAGDLLMMVGDMSVHDVVTPEQVVSKEDLIADSSIVVVDSNIQEETIIMVLKICNKYKTPVWFEPTCVTKATKPFNNDYRITYASPNLFELERIYKTVTNNLDSTCIDWFDFSVDEVIFRSIEYAQCCLGIIDNLVISLGHYGVLHVRNDVSGITAQHFQAAREDLLPVNVKSVSGAGDSFVGGMVYGLTNDFTTELAIKAGLKAAYYSLHSYDTIASEVCEKHFRADVISKWAPFQPKKY